MSRPKKFVSVNHRRSIVARYNRGEGFLTIQEAFNDQYSVPIIRRILGENGVLIRGRGRPANPDRVVKEEVV